MTSRPVVHWFRNDLRLAGNAALSAAAASGAPVILVYILDDATPGKWKMGSASRWWLEGSLAALAGDIEKRGNRLILLAGDTREVLPRLLRDTKASALYFSRCYEPFAIGLETDLKSALDAMGIAVKRYGGALLKEPEDIRTKSGDVYKVYTPFWRALSEGLKVPSPRAAPRAIPAPSGFPKGLALRSLKLRPAKPDWAGGLRAEWQPGESGALARLDSFLEDALQNYAEDRNRPDRPATSRLSPHLHFGEITPAHCWHRASEAAARTPGADKGHETFLKELVWREFSATLLFHWPDLPEVPFRREFASFPWKDDVARLEAWTRGRTGYPIVDAGMRELWQTGYMHNRVRMIAASFLVKDLLIPWQAGEAWFWDTLVDADLASNAASWQWVAGSGADAAPYFRIFNPTSQGIKFDPDGAYVRRYVPEIARLPNEHIHAPEHAPDAVLRAAGIVLDKDYPRPIVDHAFARTRALEAYQAVKRARG